MASIHRGMTTALVVFEIIEANRVTSVKHAINCSGNVDWFIEDFSSPIESSYPAPKPANGSKYLRAKRNVLLDSGLAILRSEILTVRIKI